MEKYEPAKNAATATTATRATIKPVGVDFFCDISETGSLFGGGVVFSIFGCSEISEDSSSVEISELLEIPSSLFVSKLISSSRFSSELMHC